MDFYDLVNETAMLDVKKARDEGDILRGLFGATPRSPERIRQRALSAINYEFGDKPKNMGVYEQMSNRALELGDSELAQNFLDMSKGMATAQKDLATALKPSETMLKAVSNRFKNIYGKGDIGTQFGKAALGSEEFSLKDEGTKDFFTSALKTEAEGFSTWLGSMGLTKADFREILNNSDIFDSYLDMYARSGGPASQDIARIIQRSSVPSKGLSKSDTTTETNEEFDWLSF